MSRIVLIIVSLGMLVAASLMFTQPAISQQSDQGRCVQTCQVMYDRATYPSDFSLCMTDCTESARTKAIGQIPSQPDYAKGAPKRLGPP